MSESKLRELAMDFSVQIIALVKELKAKHETVIANQIGRSGTSIGANIHEGIYAQSSPDFISKLSISLKEASESSYWLKILSETQFLDEKMYMSLKEDIDEIIRLLISSIKTTKNKLEIK